MQILQANKKDFHGAVLGILESPPRASHQDSLFYDENQTNMSSNFYGGIHPSTAGGSKRVTLLNKSEANH